MFGNSGFIDINFGEANASPSLSNNRQPLGSMAR
jgi:hypothetical protein